VSVLADGAGGAAVTERTPARTPVDEVRNGHVDKNKETRDDRRDRNSGPHPSKFLELYGVWRNKTRNSTDTGAPKRRVNVLGWGFGE
jgi:hypothetical protein